MKQIVCFGEVLWDVFPQGKKIGGAPLNVSLRALSEGYNVKLISAIGNDADGEELKIKMKGYSFNTSHVQIHPDLETSSVVVTLDQEGSASYEIKEPCAWDAIAYNQEDAELVKSSEAFIFGSLVNRSEVSRTTLSKLLQVAPFKVFDVNLRFPHYDMDNLVALMKQSDFIKFNDDEIHLICDAFGKKFDNVKECITFISELTATQKICVTLGEKGALLYIDGTFYRNHGYKVKVADTVGAGDSFLSCIISQILKEVPYQKALNYSCAVSALIASKEGANPFISKQEIDDMLKVN